MPVHDLGTNYLVKVFFLHNFSYINLNLSSIEFQAYKSGLEVPMDIKLETCGLRNLYPP